MVFKGSRYADRLPIGTKESLDAMKRDALVRFYKTWYRPDRMAVIAVGDFDANAMEQMIKQQFSDNPSATTPLPDTTFIVPPTPGTAVSVATDPEVPSTGVAMLYKEPDPVDRTIAAWREALVDNMFDAMLNARLGEMTLKPNAPFQKASIDHSGFVKGVKSISTGVTVGNNGAEAGMTALLTEIARVAQHGFTQTELDRVKAQYLSSLNNAYQNRGTQTSSRYVDQYVDHFLKDDALPSTETAIAVQQQLIPTITLADVQKEAQFINRTDNRILLVTAPEKAGIQIPDTAAMLALFKSVPSKAVAAYVDHAATGALIAKMPKPGKVVATKKIPEIDAIQWTLSNGATVFLKPTTFKEDQIILSGYKLGGNTLFADADYPTASAVPNLISAGGLGNFSIVDLRRQLAGKTVGVKVSVNDEGEWITGGSNQSDLETMLQLAYLNLTQPRLDSATMTAALQQTKTSLVNRAVDPNSVFGDTVRAILTNHSVRTRPLTPALIDQIDLNRAMALYKDRFADAARFTFAIVGSFNPDSIKPLVEQYIGSLPSLNKHEKMRDLPLFHPPRGVLKKTVLGGTEDKTITVIQFSGKYAGSLQNEQDLAVMTKVLSNRLEARLREQLAGTYGVSVNSSHHDAPVSTYAVSIQFISTPSRREELTKATYAVIDSLKKTGPTADELQRVIAPAVRAAEKARLTNDYWASIPSWAVEGRPFADVVSDTRLLSVKPAQVQHAAQQYLDMKNYAQFDMLPVTKQ